MTIEDNIKKLNIIYQKLLILLDLMLLQKYLVNYLYISGQISMNEKGELIKGKLGKELKTEEGYKAAKRCALSINCSS